MIKVFALFFFLLLCLDGYAANPALQQLQDPNKAVRIQALKSLGNFSDPDVLRVVLESYRHPDIEVRSSATLALFAWKGDGGREHIYETVADMMKEGPWPGMGDAFSFLSASKNPKVIQTITQFSKGSNAFIRLQASRALRKSQGLPASPLFIEALKGQDAAGRKFWVNGFLGLTPFPEERERLTELLMDTDYTVAAEAATMLAKHADEKTAQVMLRALQEWNRRREVGIAKCQYGWSGCEGLIFSRLAAILGTCKEKEAVGALIEAMKAPCEDARVSVLSALGQIGDPIAIDPMITALSDDSREVRLAAVAALGLFKEEKARQALAKTTSGPDQGLVEMTLLAKMKESSVSEDPSLFLKALKSQLEEVRCFAYDKLGENGDKRFIMPTIDALKKEEMQKGKLQGAISLLRYSDKTAWDAATVVFAHADSYIAYGMAQWLAGSSNPQRVDLFRAALNNPDADNITLMNILVCLQRNPKAAPVDVFFTLTNHPLVEIRVKVAELISSHSEPEAQEALSRMLSDRDRNVIKEVLTKGKSFMSPSSKEALIGIINRMPDPEIHSAVILKFQSHGDDPRVMEMVDQSLANEDARVRAAAVRVLRFMKSFKIETLEQCLNDPDESVVAASFESLMVVNGEQGSGSIIAIIKTSKNPKVRALAAKTLWKWKEPQVIETLIEATADADPEVRVAAIGSLVGAGKSDPMTVAEILGKCLKDPELIVRQRAYASLGIMLKNAEADAASAPLKTKLQDYLKTVEAN